MEAYQVDENERQLGNKKRRSVAQLSPNKASKRRLSELNTSTFTTAVTSEELKQVKAHLHQVLTEQKPLNTLIGLHDQERQLKNLVKSTLEQGESHSVLLIGPRGTAKSSLISHVLQPYHNQFHLVSLNGSVHTEDRSALESTLLQLGLKEQRGKMSEFGSFSECFLGLFRVFRERHLEQSATGAHGKQVNVAPIVFVLDEFDLFTQRAKQHLLYNLFDTVQSMSLGTPILVIGVSVRQDVVELLEKRVKSRFSHRYIYFWGPTSYSEYVEMAKTALMIPDDVYDGSALKCYQQSLEAALGEANVVKILRRLYDLEKSVRSLFRVLLLSTTKLDTRLHLHPSWIFDAYYAQFTDSKTLQLKDLSVLELCMIIAMKKLTDQQMDRFNFEMAFTEYTQFAITHNLAYKKPIAYKAFENLMEYELCRPVDTISKCPKEFRMVRLMIEPVQVKEAVLKRPELGYAIKRWCSDN